MKSQVIDLFINKKYKFAIFIIIKRFKFNSKILIKIKNNRTYLIYNKIHLLKKLKT